VIEDVPDVVRTYTADEERRLTENLQAVTTAVDCGAFSNSPFSLEVLCDLHRAIFADVRDGHAGRHRRPGFGSEWLSFGPHRSSHRDRVVPEMTTLFANLSAWIKSFDENPQELGYEEKALHVAVYSHAQMIRTHPFEDGNGRSGRLLMGAILVRLGMRQIPVEACKQEYIAALNHYYQTGEIQPLIDLFLAVEAGY
jgi:Fic family protein